MCLSSHLSKLRSTDDDADPIQYQEEKLTNRLNCEVIFCKSVLFALESHFLIFF